jgi:hypothetical protein
MKFKVGDIVWHTNWKTFLVIVGITERRHFPYEVKSMSKEDWNHYTNDDFLSPHNYKNNLFKLILGIK